MDFDGELRAEPQEADLELLLKLLADAVMLPGGLMARREFVLAGLASGLAAERWAWRCAKAGAEVDELGSGGMLAGGEVPEVTGGGGIDLVAKCDRGVSCLLASRRLSCGGVVALGFERDGAAFAGSEIRGLQWMLEEVPWLMAAESDGGGDGPGAGSLSPREHEVLTLLAEGRSRAEIADVLSLSPHTVSDYTKSVFKKFEVNSHSQLLGLALRGQLFLNRAELDE